MAGVIRVTAPRPFWRGGLQFGPEPRDLTGEDVTAGQFAAILAEPMLTVMVSMDGDLFVAPPTEWRDGIARIALGHSGLTMAEVGAKLASGEIELGLDIVAAMALDPAGTDRAPARIDQAMTAQDVEPAEPDASAEPPSASAAPAGPDSAPAPPAASAAPAAPAEPSAASAAKATGRKAKPAQG